MGFLQRVLMLMAAVCCILATAGVDAKTTSTSTPGPLELSQRLQLMAQRQAKLFLQLRLSIDAETAQRKLAEAVRSFDGTLGLLAQQRGAQGGPLELEQIEALWASARVTLHEAADPVTSVKVAQDAERLTQALQRLSEQQLPPAPSSALKLNVLAARDAMLAQKLAKLYMQLRGGDGDAERRSELAHTRQEFLETVDLLARGATSQPAIRSNIDLVRQQWSFFETALNSSERDVKTMRTVASTSERISQTLTDIAEAYLGLTAGDSVLAQAGR